MNVKRTKKVKMFSRDYGFDKSQTSNIQKIFGLFQAKNIFIEIIGIEKDSNFFQEMQKKKDEYSLIFGNELKDYIDIFISNCSRENIAEILDYITNNCLDCPEMLIIYFTNLSLEEFLSYDRNRYGVKMITHQIIVCACEAMFDENVLSITFNADYFNPREYVSKLDEIFLKIKKPD